MAIKILRAQSVPGLSVNAGDIVLGGLTQSEQDALLQGGGGIKVPGVEGFVLLNASQAAALPGLVSGAGKFRGVYVSRPAGKIEQSGGGDVGRHMAIALPKSARAARIRLVNAYGAMTGLKASLAWSQNGTDPNAPVGDTWTAATWAGAASIDMPSAVGSGDTVTTLQFADSDLIAKPSVAVDAGVSIAGVRPGAIAMVRTYQPAGQSFARMSLTEAPTFAQSGLHGSFGSGQGDIVATPANYVPSAISNYLPSIELILYGEQDVRTFMPCGASNMSGWGDNSGGADFALARQRGWSWRACNAITSIAVIPVAHGWGGQSTVYSLPLAIAALRRIRPSAAAYMPISPNDSDCGTAAGDARMIAGAAAFIDECRAQHVVPMLATIQAWSTATSQQHASRRTVNAASRALCAATGATLLDFEALLSSGDGWANAAYTVDGTHQSPTAHALSGATFAPLIEAACS